ncbi:diacylglycerol kinase family protein [Patescibacteria group bacterium]|nr:diacylglycerol kinase family protein [Patescibacteria group bacterium]MBU1062888.1 diacylglycerol kinase family protein [Patescibacteria group bacterium]MBU1871112.1 diacylglycerol kinase family protein [Patescibacteria group bacterium]
MIKITRLCKSFIYAWRGLRKVFKEEQNLRIQAVVGLVAFILAWFFQVSRWEWIVLVLIVMIVIIMELANSVVERIVDALKPRIHIYVKEIKDIMAASVLVSSIIAFIVGCIIFWPHLINSLGQF